MVKLTVSVEPEAGQGQSNAGPWPGPPDRRPPDGRGARAANHRGAALVLTVRETHRQRAPPPLARGQSESRLVTGNSRRRLTRSLPPFGRFQVSHPSRRRCESGMGNGQGVACRRGGRMNGHGFSTIARRQLQLLPPTGRRLFCSC
jgi:hypothetical protein